MRILNFGSLNIDYIYSVDHIAVPGETETSDDMQIVCGGKGLNQSIALAKAGAKVFHAGNIGIDDGQILKDTLISAGVNVDYISEVDCPSGNALIQVDKKGENCIILYSGANRKFRRSQIDDVLVNFNSGDLLVLQNEINELSYIIDEAHKRDIRIAFNPSPVDDALFRLPLDKIDYFFVNEIEAKAILGVESDKNLVENMASKFPGSKIVLTRGKSGAEAVSKGRYYRHDAYKVDVLDTTAAGDTFTGFYLASMLRGKSIDECMDIASRASSICVGRKGASSSIPTIEEVVRRL